MLSPPSLSQPPPPPPSPPPPPPPPPPIHCQVFTWGCNDEGALGRDGDEYTPLPVVKLKDHVIRQVSAGDSHTAALTSSGCVYFWGVFRVSVCVCVCVCVCVRARARL